MENLPPPIDRRAENSSMNACELAERRMILTSRPRMVFLELTQACNLSCPMCRPQVLAGAKWHMQDAVLETVLSELSPYAEWIDLRGWGESTLFPRFWEVVDRLSDQGCQLKMYSNLGVRKENFWEEIGARGLLVGVSLESADPDRYASFRRGGSFERFRKNLAALRRSQMEAGLEDRIYFAVAISEENCRDLESVVRLAADSGILSVRLNPVTSAPDPQGYPQHGMSLARILEVRDLLERTCALAEDLGVTVDLMASPATTGLGGFDRCMHAWSYVLVKYDGAVNFCDCLDTHPNAVFGSLLQAPFMDIWNSVEYRQLRDDMARQDFARLAGLGLECDWCHGDRFGDCEYLFDANVRRPTLRSWLERLSFPARGEYPS